MCIVSRRHWRDLLVCGQKLVRATTTTVKRERKHKILTCKKKRTQNDSCLLLLWFLTYYIPKTGQLLLVAAFVCYNSRFIFLFCPATRRFFFLVFFFAYIICWCAYCLLRWARARRACSLFFYVSRPRFTRLVAIWIIVNQIIIFFFLFFLSYFSYFSYCCATAVYFAGRKMTCVTRGRPEIWE